MHIAGNIASAAQHLHAKGIMHGDLYAHNIAWLREECCFLSDLGAATCYPRDVSGYEESLQRLDVLAYGHLLGELLHRSVSPPARPLQELQKRCVSEITSERPLFEEILDCVAR
jgi:serine/threonine protein kinase